MENRLTGELEDWWSADFCLRQKLGAEASTSPHRIYS